MRELRSNTCVYNWNKQSRNKNDKGEKKNKIWKENKNKKKMDEKEVHE